MYCGLSRSSVTISEIFKRKLEVKVNASESQGKPISPIFNNSSIYSGRESLSRLFCSTLLICVSFYLQQETTNLVPTSSTRNSPPNPKATTKPTIAKITHSPRTFCPPSHRAPSKSPQREVPRPPSPIPPVSCPITMAPNHPWEAPCTTRSAPIAPYPIPVHTRPLSPRRWCHRYELPDRVAM